MVPSPPVTSQSFWESWRQWRTAPNQMGIPAVTLVSHHSELQLLRTSKLCWGQWARSLWIFQATKPQVFMMFQVSEVSGYFRCACHRWFYKGLDKVTTLKPYHTRPCNHVRLVHISHINSYRFISPSAFRGFRGLLMQASKMESELMEHGNLSWSQVLTSGNKWQTRKALN